MKKVDLHPSLNEVIVANGMSPDELRVAVTYPIEGKTLPPDAIPVLDLLNPAKAVFWSVPSIRTLFRGDVVPPPMTDEPPKEYIQIFLFIELHVIEFCGAFGDKTDGEFEEAYSNLRRRPDGKSLSPLHAYLRQVGAVVTGRWPLSSPEFEAIFGRLTRSARTFRMGVVSRNYIAALRQFARG